MKNKTSSEENIVASILIGLLLGLFGFGLGLIFLTFIQAIGLSIIFFVIAFFISAILY